MDFVSDALSKSLLHGLHTQTSPHIPSKLSKKWHLENTKKNHFTCNGVKYLKMVASYFSCFFTFISHRKCFIS